MAKETSIVKTNSMLPRELKLGPQDSAGKKAGKGKHEKQRSDSQQNQRVRQSYHQSSNAFAKKGSYLPLSGQEGSFQQSGKQIIQGQ